MFHSQRLASEQDTEDESDDTSDDAVGGGDFNGGDYSGGVPKGDGDAASSGGSKGWSKHLLAGGTTEMSAQVLVAAARHSERDGSQRIITTGVLRDVAALIKLLLALVTLSILYSTPNILTACDESHWPSPLPPALAAHHPTADLISAACSPVATSNLRFVCTGECRCCFVDPFPPVQVHSAAGGEHVANYYLHCCHYIR